MIINKQQKSKVDHNLYSTLKVSDMFKTIQGEGKFQGRRAIFIRLAGCNIQCPGCDTEYSNFEEVKIKDIVARVLFLLSGESSLGYLIVITGGEPLRQNLSELFDRLLAIGCNIQVETNGTCFFHYDKWDKITVCCSPKTPKINDKLKKYIAFFKYVIPATAIDLFNINSLPVHALGHIVGEGRQKVLYTPFDDDLIAFRVKMASNIFITPQDYGEEEMNNEARKNAVSLAIEQGYILQAQVHKLYKLK